MADFSQFLSNAQGVTSLAGNALGVLDGVAGFFGSSSSQRYNRDLMREQQRWQSSEALKQRQWQSEEAKLARDYTTEMWNKNNEYNTPLALRNRLSAAGINPNLAVDNTSAAQGMASLPSSSMGTAGANPAGVSTPYVGDSSFLKSFNGVASMLKDLAEAKNLGVDTEYLEKSLKSRLSMTEAQSAIEQVVARFKSTMTEKELNKLDALITNIESLTSKYKSDAWLADEQAATETDRRNLLRGELKKVLSDAGLSKVMTKQIQSLLEAGWVPAVVSQLNASAARDYSQSRLNDAIAETENTLRSDKKALLAAQAGLASLDEAFARETNPTRKKAMLSEWNQQAVRAGIITEQMKAELDAALINNSFAPYEKIFGMIESGTRSFKNVTEGIGSLKSLSYTSGDVNSSGGTYFDGDGNVIGRFEKWSDKKAWKYSGVSPK